MFHVAEQRDSENLRNLVNLILACSELRVVYQPPSYNEDSDINVRKLKKCNDKALEHSLRKSYFSCYYFKYFVHYHRHHRHSFENGNLDKMLERPSE